MVQQRFANEDFVLTNLQSIAICSALSKNVEWSDVEQRIFGGFSNDKDDIVLNHNTRASYLAAGICVLYAKDDRVGIKLFIMTRIFSLTNQSVIA
jgi:hypothetical protein